MPRRFSLLVLTALALAAPSRASEEAFRKHVAPMLSRSCMGCHDGARKRGGLDLSARDAAMKGGDGGAVIVPGSAARSKLIEAVCGEKARMPQSGPKLTAGEVAVLAKWID